MGILELALIGVATVVALIPIVRARSVLGAWGPAWAAGVIGLTAALGLAWSAHREARAASRAALEAAAPGSREPGETARDAYVGSKACRACHPSEYQSWHDSYHRTMTTLAGPDTVMGDFGGVQISDRGRQYRMARRGDEYWVSLPDPDVDWSEHDGRRSGEGVQVEQRVVMVTGSHDTQIYWVGSSGGNRLNFFPLGWKIPTREWIPVQDLFLRGPDNAENLALWNYTCITCHATGPLSRPEDPAGGNLVPMDTRVAELGIACEACHGPGGTHVAKQRSPVTRWLARADDEPDDSIVNPASLPRERQSDVCGQCHGISLFRKKLPAIWQTGFAYRPGDEIDEVRGFLSPRRKPFAKYIAHQKAQDPLYLENHFWPDGQVRVSGRDYSSMIDSKCASQGELSCLDCHSLHDSEPDDQLKVWDPPHRACTQCHEAIGQDVPAHSHHEAGSPGSDCLGCHMPYTTYGLLKSIRSHTITSPSVAETIEHGRPNACNLCHLDRTLAWTAQQLEESYGQAAPTIEGDDGEIALAARMMLSGDAAQRAIVAWNAGHPVARQVSGAKAVNPYLVHLLDDPYPAVRYIAQQALRAGDVDLGDYDHRTEPTAQEATTARLRRAHPSPLPPATHRRLASDRDDRPLDLRE